MMSLTMSIRIHKQKPQQSGGYITLFTVLILTSVLFIVVFASNTSGFQASEVMINALNKEESRQAARGCLDLARARYVQDNTYRGQEDIMIGDIECRLERIEDDEIRVRVEYNDSLTSLRALVNPSTANIIEFEELTN